MSTRVGVVVFPGSNCDGDAMEAVQCLGATAEVLWHADDTTRGVDAVIVPGGFAHGDYLRPGAIAHLSPVMSAVAAFAAAGGPVLGICNGFQILAESGLVPGALQKNQGLKFLCTTVELRVVSVASVLTSGVDGGSVLRLPVNHFEGNYTCSPETLAELRGDDRVVLRYVQNPNGSIDDIAGVCSAGRNVVGIMPHPERASDPLLGSTDGIPLLRSFLSSAAASAQPPPREMPARLSTAGGTPS
ncbi:MAG: phosphoribosylformylglycinamidine synthase subunit PurQ [Acidimicrobiales bacterium]